MKKTTTIIRVFLLSTCLMFLGIVSQAQTFNCFISNDHLVSRYQFEFDVNLQSLSEDFNLRTIQMAFTINPEFTPAGSRTTIDIVRNSSQMTAPMTRELVKQNASPSLSAFQIASSIGVNCSNGTLIAKANTKGTRIATIRIISTEPFNNVPHNISMIRPGDALQGGNVNLRMALTKWNAMDCSVGTNTIITKYGTYTNAPVVTQNTTTTMDAFALNVSPNPSDGSTVNLFISGIAKNEKAFITVVDAIGKVSYINKEVYSDERGTVNTDLNLSDILQSGLYTVVVNTTDKTMNTKIQINK